MELSLYGLGMQTEFLYRHLNGFCLVTRWAMTLCRNISKVCTSVR